MCYLCLQGFQPFEVKDSSKFNLENKKARAKEIKTILRNYESVTDVMSCESSQKEIDKLKEEQYALSREM